MKKTTRKLLSLAMASAMAASLLTGCGGGGAGETTAAAGAEKTEAGKTETESGSTEAAAAADADYSQDVITYGMTQAWDTINPYGSSSGSIYQNLSATSFMTVWLLLKRPEPM